MTLKNKCHIILHINLGELTIHIYPFVTTTTPPCTHTESHPSLLSSVAGNGGYLSSAVPKIILLLFLSSDNRVTSFRDLIHDQDEDEEEEEGQR
jgi:hypothetical protein